MSLSRGARRVPSGSTTNVHSTTRPVRLRRFFHRKKRTNLKQEGQAMTVATPRMSRAFHKGGVVSGADVSFDEHERLALAMLAVEAGDVADVEEAMRKIIASAPDATDVALLLTLAIAHAGDRALRGESPVIGGELRRH